jgi:hypothetical protein
MMCVAEYLRQRLARALASLLDLISKCRRHPQNQRWQSQQCCLACIDQAKFQ